jgi:glycogen debranching enzyme
MKNCKATMDYHKVEEQRFLVTNENPLLDPYFSVLEQSQQAVVHNGWISDAKHGEDFAEEINWNYLRRAVNIWGDSIKLRYGKCPADSPFLWDHMSQYVSQMAQIFAGFRLDNAHGTPIHVC